MTNTKIYTDEEKQAIYSAWYKYQKANNMPISEYGYKAYTDETYSLWEKVLNA